MKSTSGRSAKLVPTEATFSVNYTLSPRSQLRKTGKVTQTSMFRTNKKALIFMRFEQNEFKILIYHLKITFTYFD